ncbi:MAG: transcription termination/antitermination protein NusA [Erysipelotrichales bacterium]|nr:transcription termination/antitermination protein NusA [Erysipelotrichales bacterium]
MELDYKKIKASIGLLAEAYHLPMDVAEDTLKEALAKGYRKHINVPDIMIRVEMDDKNERILMYQQKTVVADEPEDDELEISLEDAQKEYPNILIGDMYETLIPDAESITTFGRGDVALVKNVLRQKTREAQKQEIYDKYIDHVGDMVNGIVDKVEERFVIVRLDSTEALMPKSAQMPQELYREGDRIRVIISDVNKDTKGSQVLVSRADRNLVKRLFELEVPEIYQGIVEIRAISREAGERTKMAVYSKNPQVDAIGACIGPRGSRVQVVIEELKGEKIDIFEWSEDDESLIRNALAPAQVEAVIRNPRGEGLLVVVADDQLSLAIGRRGNNVRLAVNLVEKKIDIKSVSALANEGIDWQTLALEERLERQAAARAAELEREQRQLEAERQREELEKAQAAAKEEAQRKAMEAEEAAKLEAEKTQTEEAEEPDQTQETVTPEIKETPEIEQVPLFEEIEETKPETQEEPEKKRKKKVHVAASDYVSKFESLAGAKSTQEPEKAGKKKKFKKNDEEEKKLKLKDMLKDREYEIRPEYSEEELAEIEELEAEEWDSQYDDDIDYDEYDKYYDEEDY